MIAPASPLWLRLGLVSFIALIVGMRLFGVDPLAGLERRLYDSVLEPLLPEPPTSNDIVIVAIDDRSLVEGGERWPLSRSTWATFVRRLDALRPSAIALDVVFDQDSQSDLLQLATQVRTHVARAGLGSSEVVAKVLEIIDDTASELDADLRLAQALASAGNITLGVILTDRHPLALSEPLIPEPLEFGLDGEADLTVDLPTLVSSAPRLFISARSHGAMNVVIDPDATVRRYPLIIGHEGRPIASLALATRISDLRPAEALPLIQRAYDADRGAPLLRFRPKDKGFQVLSFADVISGDPATLTPMLRGKIVLVGSTASGIEDLLRTPRRVSMPGVEVHATALENLLLGTWLESEGAGGPVGLFATIAFVGGFSILLGRRLRARTQFLFGVGLLVLHFATAVVLADGAGWLVALSPAPLGLVLLGFSEAGHRWLWSRREQVRLEERERVLEAERAALERFRAVVEHVADAIVSVDESQRIRWMNPAAESLFQRRARTAVDRPVAELIARLRNDETFGEVLAAEARVGAHVVPVEATATQMRVGGERYTNFVFRDVAARKALERQKDDFIASINHELRTPITSIIGSLRLVTAGALDPVPPRVRDLLLIAEKNGERLLTLVNDLLDAAKLDAGRLSLERKPVALNELVSEAVDRCKGFGLQFDVVVSLAPFEGAVAETVVDVDRERMIQVVGNLVSNAVKHSNRGANVVVEVRLEGDRAKVLVSDTGPGIPEEFHDQLFERFTMTVAGDGKRRPGTGLGLAIAKGLIEAHDGTIGFHSKVAVGTTFWFDLPTLA